MVNLVGVFHSCHAHALVASPKNKPRFTPPNGLVSPALFYGRKPLQLLRLVFDQKQFVLLVLHLARVARTLDEPVFGGLFMGGFI